jgi:superfamily I DNA and RNA helicase
MAEIVYGEQAVSGVARELVRIFENADWSGTLYIGYPILSNVEGTVRTDALYVSQQAGVVVFDTNHLQVRQADEPMVDQVRNTQDKLFAALSSKLLETPELLERRQLAIPISVISISTQEDFSVGDALVSTVEQIPSHIGSSHSLSLEKYEILNSVIERTATIRPRKKRTNATRQDSRGTTLKIIEKNIANLDAWQKRAAIEVPTGPQRIRGLAGSGKTIVLALKAAFLHAREPSWRIALTFQTRSLYEQFRRLVRQFCFEFSKEEPDWDKLTIIHAWGSSSSLGVYSEMASALGQTAIDFTAAKGRYGTGGAFSGICKELLSSVPDKEAVPRLYDAILIDEAQDLPPAFFELVFLFTKEPKRIIYAYDEMQNLSDFTMMRAEELFGKKRNNGRTCS